MNPRSPGSRAFWTTALTALCCAVALSLPLGADAAVLSVGSAMPVLSLSDQHDKPAPVMPQTRWVIFTTEKPVNDMVSAVLAAEPAGVVDRLNLVVVADISGMPAMVTRLFALPKLRELPFPIALVREPAQLAQVADIPRLAGNATVLHLEAGRVVRLTPVRQTSELRALLGLPPNPTTP